MDSTGSVAEQRLQSVTRYVERWGDRVRQSERHFSFQ